MEKYTVSRELAQKLRYEGFTLQTQFLWVERRLDEWHLLPASNALYAGYVSYAPAPLSDELRLQLLGVSFSVYQSVGGGIVINEATPYSKDGKRIHRVFYEKLGITSLENEACALAELWLFCKANGHLKPKGSEE